MLTKTKLEDLIRLFHEGEVVEKIITAENHLEEYEKQKNLYKEQLEDFKKTVDKEYVNCGCYRCRECPHDVCKLKTAIREQYKILPKDAVQICVICIMADVDDNELFANYGDLVKALNMKFFSHVAKEMSKFLGHEKQIFSGHEEKEMIERFFA